MISSKLFDKRDYEKPEYRVIKEYFEHWWHILAAEGIKFTYSSWNRAWEYGQVINSIPDWKDKAVLDLGTSASLFPAYAVRKLGSGMTTFDMEWHNERVYLYKKMAAHCIVDDGNMTKVLPYRDGLFDIVVSFSVLEHLPDLQRAIAEMKRVCKPGGYIAITTDVAPAKPTVEKSGYTFTVEELLDMHTKFGLPIVGESNYHNVDITKPEELAVEGKYTFASLVMQNI